MDFSPPQKELRGKSTCVRKWILRTWSARFRYTYYYYGVCWSRLQCRIMRRAMNFVFALLLIIECDIAVRYFATLSAALLLDVIRRKSRIFQRFTPPYRNALADTKIVGWFVDRRRLSFFFSLPVTLTKKMDTDVEKHWKWSKCWVQGTEKMSLEDEPNAINEGKISKYKAIRYLVWNRKRKYTDRRNSLSVLWKFVRAK